MSGGRLVGVVGPSGVGKDSVIEALAAAQPGLEVVRRVITRDERAGGEAFTEVTPQEFARLRDAGAFALHWRAHGLCYGIPVEIADRLAHGATCLVNLSRTVLVEAERRFPGFVTLHLTAPPAILAARLGARGREDTGEIAARLARASYALPQGLGRVVTLDNGGSLEDTVQKGIAALQLQKV